MRGLKALPVLAFALAGHAQEYVISTFAGGAPPPTPVPGVDMPLGTLQSVAADAMGNTYFIASHCVFKLDQNGVVTRIAGDGRSGYSGDGGPATRAQLRLENSAPGKPLLPLPAPPGLAVDNAGNVFVADNGNYRIRKISGQGIITTVAGNGTAGFSGDGGPATSAQLSPVFGLAIDVAGNLLITDSNRIRRVTRDGSIATIAGTGACGFSGDGGPAIAAQLCGPEGLAADSTGNVFVADAGNSRVRQVFPDGSIATIAGKGVPDYTDLGDCSPTGDGGPATSAWVCMPGAIAVDRAGNVFVANYDGWAEVGVATVRKIAPGGAIATVAGFTCAVDPSPLCYDVPDLGSAATKTYLGGPLGLAVDNAGSLIVADDFGPQQGALPDRPHILKVSPDGAIATQVGNGGPTFSSDGGPAAHAQLAVPEGVAVDGAGNLFIADYANDGIRKVAPDGIITTVAGIGTYGNAGDGGPATSAELAPVRLVADSVGNLFFFDIPNRSVRKISADGIINTVVQVGGNDYFVALDRAGDLFTADPTNTFYAIAEISPNGTIRRVAGGANSGCGTYNGCSGFLGDGGPATSAQLVGPQGVAVDAGGNIFIADSADHRIRKVTPDGIITTVAGNSPVGPNPGSVQGGFSGDGGRAIDAQLSFPMDVTVDGAGNIYIADYGNNRIRKVSQDGIIRTIAGNGTQGYSGDGGPATRASLSEPSALALDSAGNIYVADTGNNAIRVLRPIQRTSGR